jgi:hypothetical protein
MLTIHSIENPALFESPLLTGHPGALARDPVERASAVLQWGTTPPALRGLPFDPSTLLSL